MKLLLLLVILALPAFGGGWFVLSVGDPSAHSNADARASAFVVRVYGCSAAAATLSATAEGRVDGQRRSIALTLIPVGRGTDPQNTWAGHFDFAVPAGLPEGEWVVKVVASTGWQTKSVLVPVSAGKLVRTGTKFGGTFTEQDVSAALTE